MEEIQRRLDTILARQGGWVSTFGLTDTDYFFVIGLYLNPDDLEAVRPTLRDAPDKPVVGVGPRYRGHAVYPAAELPSGGRCCAEYRGVWFTYMPMDFVE